MRDGNERNGATDGHPRSCAGAYRAVAGTDLQAAIEQATEILKAVPNHPLATLLLATAQRVRGDAAAAITILEPLVQAQPKWAAAHYELGVLWRAKARERRLSPRYAARLTSSPRWSTHGVHSPII